MALVTETCTGGSGSSRCRKQCANNREGGPGHSKRRSVLNPGGQAQDGRRQQVRRRSCQKIFSSDAVGILYGQSVEARDGACDLQFRARFSRKSPSLFPLNGWHRGRGLHLDGFSSRHALFSPRQRFPVTTTNYSLAAFTVLVFYRIKPCLHDPAYGSGTVATGASCVATKDLTNNQATDILR